MASESGKPKKPKGWYSRTEREKRAAVYRERRERAALERRLKERRMRGVLAIREGAETQLRADQSDRRVRANTVRQQQIELERRMQGVRLIAAARWSHKNEGTAETHEHASRTRQGSLARLYMAGDISADELAWAVEIGMAAEMIERDVAVKVIDYEPRIDCSASGRDSMIEGIKAVRRQVAYTYWREWIPQPKRAILDMLVGEPKSFSMIARQYRMHKRRARALLITAINLWPDAMKQAEERVDDATLAAAYAGIL